MTPPTTRPPEPPNAPAAPVFLVDAWAQRRPWIRWPLVAAAVLATLLLASCSPEAGGPAARAEWLASGAVLAIVLGAALAAALA